MKRREFITLLGGAAAAWPIPARAQQADHVTRIGALMKLKPRDDPEGQSRLFALAQGLQESGWTIGRNLRIDTRWGAGDAERYRRYAAELVALAPEVILVNGPAALAQLQQITRSLPIVFTNVTDPVGAGFVDSVARPGGNTTGFMLSEYSTSGKAVELLKEIAPRMTRAAILRDPTLTSSVAQFAAIQSAAASLGLELSPIDMRNTREIERSIAVFARVPNGGLIVTTGGSSARSSLIVTAAARQRLPAVYPFRYYVADGGLISYGPNPIDQYRRAAGYIDRILKGEKPADLPVQAPTKYELVVNLKTAKALGLEVPPTVLARADEVIE